MLSKKEEDCPDILLREEKKALKQSREVLVVQLKSLREVVLTLNAVQQEFEKLVRQVLLIEKIFDVRFVSNIAAERVKGN